MAKGNNEKMVKGLMAETKWWDLSSLLPLASVLLLC